MKFKVGDKVKVVKKVEVNENGDSCRWSNDNAMDNFIGKTGIIASINQICNHYRVDFTNPTDSWVYLPECLELVTLSLPINITFKNKYEHQAVQQFLFDNGCKWCNGGETTPLPFGEKIIRVTTDKRLVNADNTGLGDYPTYTINDLDTIKEILNSSKPITEFELNREYTAIIDPNTNTVKVGCQTFTFDKIKELASKLGE